MRSRNNLNGTDEQNLILYPTRLKLLCFLVITLIFIAIGIWMILHNSNPVNIAIAIFAIVFFGVGFLVLLFQFVKPIPLLIVDDIGFHQRNIFGKDQFIAWEEIALIFSSREHTQYLLNVCVSESGMEALSVRYPKPERILPLVGSKIAIDFSSSNVSAQKLLEIIQSRYQKQIEQNTISIYHTVR